MNNIIHKGAFMCRSLSLTLLLCAFPLLAGDLLLDDFDSGTGRNCFGLYWFYFSDINDSGTSIIHNAVAYPDGGYSRIVNSKHGSESNLCASIEFTLGDTLPCDTWKADEPCVGFDAFVGIGTDLAQEKHVYNLEDADSISFQACCSEEFTVCFEIVSANCFDRNYYQRRIPISTEWRRYTVYFNDLYQKIWGEELDLHESLEQVLKLTWQIRAERKVDNLRSGIFFIDSVIIHGIEQVMQTFPQKTVRPLLTVSQSHTVLYDLFGRVMTGINSGSPAPGAAIRNCGTNRTLHIIMGGSLMNTETRPAR